MKKKAFIPISALVGALLLAVIAGMTPFVAERNLAYAQTDSDVATLRSLSVNPGTLIPEFDPTKLAVGADHSGTAPDLDAGESEASAHAYEVNVRNDIDSLTVSAATTDSRASVQYKIDSGTYSNDRSIDLSLGLTVILVQVTAENGLTEDQKYYQITVNRARTDASPDATVSTLTVNPGMTDNPMELGEEFEYSVDLPYTFADADANADGSQVTVIATPSEDDAVVTVKKGNKVISEETTDDNYLVTIDVGDNTITVDVRAPNFVATETYTLTINRARVNASGDARLNSLSLSDGTLMPAFDAADLPTADNATEQNTGTTAELAHPYEVSLPHGIFEVTVMAATMDSRAKWEVTIPDDDDSDPNRRGHQVDVSNTDDSTAITIVVTAEDRLPANQKYYRVTVTRATVSASTDATLSVLTVNPGMTDDADDAAPPSETKLGEEFEYSVDLPYGIGDADADADGSQVTVVATPSEDDAVVTVKKGNKVISEETTDGNNYLITIDVGDNTITMDVLAPNFVATKTYTLTINRARRTPRTTPG